MKILAIADRPPKEKIKSILEQNPYIDLICTLGDLDYLQLIELQYIKDIPKVGVYGNHCSGKYFEELGIINLHLTTFELKGVLFGGFEGSVRYKDDLYAKMYTQEEANELLKNFPAVDVFVSHCPPYEINDEPNELSHQGFHALRTYIETQKPKYFFHGHTYPKQETIITQHKSTKIVYIYADKVINI